MPIGIDHTSVEGNKDELTIICRIVWYSWHEAKIPEEPVKDTTEEDAIAMSEQDVDEFLDDDDYEDVVKGPHGHYINIDAFEELTKDGCVMCTGPIFVEDCEELEWVGEMDNQPLCMGCLEYQTQASPMMTKDDV